MSIPSTDISQEISLAKAAMLSPQIDRITSRRLFLQFLVASPLFTRIGSPAFAQNTSATPRLPDPMVWAPRDLDKVISDPKEALDVFDFEPVAKKNVPPAHFGYMVAGIDDEVTLRANREGFVKFQLRPRRLVDVSTIDMTTEILGAKYDSPIESRQPRATVPFIRTERSRLPEPQEPATTFRCSPLWRPPQSRMRLQRAARRCGFNYIRRGSGKLPKPLSDGRNEPDPQ
jgi:hypothetical protein